MPSLELFDRAALLARQGAEGLFEAVIVVNRIWLGVALVLSFSIGLAITLIAAGVGAPLVGVWASLPNVCRISPASS